MPIWRGSSKFGGVVCLSGDDHTAESSTNAHQTEFNFVDTMIPILNPAGVQEILDFGLHAFALSRYAGVWVAVKGVKDNVESTASVEWRIDRVSIAIPNDFEMPPGGSTFARVTISSSRRPACMNTSARRFWPISGPTSSTS